MYTVSSKTSLQLTTKEACYHNCQFRRFLIKKEIPFKVVIFGYFNNLEILSLLSEGCYFRNFTVLLLSAEC